MNKTRWIAIGAAIFLLVVSIGFRFVSSVFATDLEDVVVSSEHYNQEIVRKGGGQKIAVINLNGEIMDTHTSSSFLNDGGYNHNQFLQKLEHVGKDPGVDGIILCLDTPGGGVVESDEIYNKINEVKKSNDKPVYVSMGNTAASGGYYLSAAADKIVAHPATLTGSIGVIMQSTDVSELADNLGIDMNTIKSGEFKDINSPTREMTDKEREILQTMVDEQYDDFVNAIVEGRDMSEDKVRELGDGRVYTGKQAYNNGLVDDLGNLEDTADLMQDDLDWSNAKVVEYKSKTTFKVFTRNVAQSLFDNGNGKAAAMKKLLEHSDGPRPMYLYTK